MRYFDTPFTRATMLLLGLSTICTVGMGVCNLPSSYPSFMMVVLTSTLISVLILAHYKDDEAIKHLLVIAINGAIFFSVDAVIPDPTSRWHTFVTIIITLVTYIGISTSLRKRLDIKN